MKNAPLSVKVSRPFLTWHKCCHISAASPVIPSQMEACVCWWMQGNSSVNYDPFTENKSQWCVQYDHVGVLYGTVACTALALRIPGFQHLLCCCSSFPQSRLDTRPANISEPVINKKVKTRKQKNQCENYSTLRMWVWYRWCPSEIQWPLLTVNWIQWWRVKLGKCDPSILHSPLRAVRS